MTEEQLAQIERKLKKANLFRGEAYKSLTCGHLRMFVGCVEVPWNKAQVGFVVTASDDIRDLIAEVRRLRGDVK